MILDYKNWTEPNWQGQERIVKPIDKIGDAYLVLVNYKRDYGWDNKWFMWFGPPQFFDERQVWLIPVLSQSFLTTGAGSNQTWTYDNTWNNSNNTVECLGAGASGSASQLGTNPHAHGGGGGAYTRQGNITLSVNATYQCGAQGTGVAAATAGSAGSTDGNNGGDTWFNDTAYPTTGSNKVGAKGGTKGTSVTVYNSLTAGGAGGSSASAYPATPTAAYSGGAGGAHNLSSGSAATGGGGAAGYSANGGDAPTNTTGSSASAGGAAGTDTGGTAGNGGAGGAGTYWQASPTKYGSGGGGGALWAALNSTQTAFAGGNYGGGGGACYNNRGAPTGSVRAVSGAGTQGIVVLTWTPSTAPAVTALNINMPMLGM